MVKWVREQLRALRSFRGNDTSTTALVDRDLPRTVIVAALMPLVSKRVATISSVGFEPLSESEPSALPGNLPARVIMSARRPGVHTRWKEQNRLAFKRSL